MSTEMKVQSTMDEKKKSKRSIVVIVAAIIIEDIASKRINIPDESEYNYKAATIALPST